MRFDSNNFKEIIHYICRKKASNPEQLNSTKLQKILWYLDIKSYRLTGEPLTGIAYIKHQWGPFSNAVGEATSQLAKERRLTIRTVEVGEREQHEYIGIGQPDVSFLNDRQIRWLDETIESICDGHTAESISEKSHDEMWKTAEMFELLPVGAAAIRFIKPSQETIDWARSEIGSR